MAAWDALMDRQRRTISPLVFTDPEVSRAEQEHIFSSLLAVCDA